MLSTSIRPANSDNDDTDGDDVDCSAQLLLNQTGHLSISQLQQLSITEISHLCPQLPHKVIQVQTVFIELQS